jgi:hypothetical protein
MMRRILMHIYLVSRKESQNPTWFRILFFATLLMKSGKLILSFIVDGHKILKVWEGTNWCMKSGKLILSFIIDGHKILKVWEGTNW